MASHKRKADQAFQKFYAVRSGHRPGVYLKWPECQAQIAGFKGAQFKSFATREDAVAFVAGRTPPSEALASNDKPDKFYAVARGRKPGIYTDWETASAAIKGTKGPKYKKFATRPEALSFMRLHGDAATVLAMEGSAADEEEDENEDEDEDEDEDEEFSLGEFGGFGEEELPELKKARATKSATTAMIPTEAEPLAGKGGKLLRIYTDGSSRGNGYHGASAGVGVFFGAGDPRNISERLQGQPQTNQRAELTAILRALEVTSAKQGIQIITDSKYAIQCITEWYRNWERNGWMTKDGPVKNRDLVEAIRKRISERESHRTQTLFTWVKGHATDAGNIAADSLAVQGAMGILS